MHRMAFKRDSRAPLQGWSCCSKVTWKTMIHMGWDMENNGKSKMDQLDYHHCQSTLCCMIFQLGSPGNVWQTLPDNGKSHFWSIPQFFYHLPVFDDLAAIRRYVLTLNSLRAGIWLKEKNPLKVDLYALLLCFGRLNHKMTSAAANSRKEPVQSVKDVGSFVWTMSSVLVLSWTGAFTLTAMVFVVVLPWLSVTWTVNA